MKVLLMGAPSGRLDCLAETFKRSPKLDSLTILTTLTNPSLEAKGEVIIDQEFGLAELATLKTIYDVGPDLVFVSDELPLSNGMVDKLTAYSIPTIGPTVGLAQIETSKIFMRTLLDTYGIPGNPRLWRAFSGFDKKGVQYYMKENMGGEFVVKPDGLTGGKGVRVMGDHFQTINEALDYCEYLHLWKDSPFIIEEKLDGVEFSLMSFYDGKTAVHMPLVQDHKRIFANDLGPNTGGMGSYSCADHSLPFLTPTEVQVAKLLNSHVLRCLQENGGIYRGILYGNYMITRDGLKIIEFNARAGDSEIMNVLPLLETDFIDVCMGILEGKLARVPVKFSNKATVCKYVVPRGYPDDPTKATITFNAHPGPDDNVHAYYGGIDGDMMTGSRAVAYTGIADTLEDAEHTAEKWTQEVLGPVSHRYDVGTTALIESRRVHAERVRN